MGLLHVAGFFSFADTGYHSEVCFLELSLKTAVLCRPRMASQIQNSSLLSLRPEYSV